MRAAGRFPVAGAQLGVPPAELVGACQGPNLVDESVARLAGELLPALAARPGAARECAAQLERLALHADRRVGRLAMAVMVSSRPASGGGACGEKEGGGTASCAAHDAGGTMAPLLQRLNGADSAAARAALRQLTALYCRLQLQGDRAGEAGGVLEEVQAGCRRLDELARPAKGKGRKSMFAKKERRDRTGVLHHTALAAVRACQAQDPTVLRDVPYLVHLRSRESGAVTHALALAEASARSSPEVVAGAVLPLLESLASAPGAFVDSAIALGSSGLDVSDSWVRLHLVKVCGVLVCALPPVKAGSANPEADSRRLLMEFLACVGLHDPHAPVALEALDCLLVGRRLGLQSPDHIAGAAARAFEYLISTNAGEVRFQAGWRAGPPGDGTLRSVERQSGGLGTQRGGKGSGEGAASSAGSGGGGSAVAGSFETRQDPLQRNRSLLDALISRLTGQLLPHTAQPVTFSALGVLKSALVCVACARLTGSGRGGFGVGSPSSLSTVGHFEDEVAGLLRKVRAVLDGLMVVKNPFLDVAVLRCRAWLLNADFRGFDLDATGVDELLGQPGVQMTLARVTCIKLLDELEYRAGLLPTHSRGAYDCVLAAVAACPTPEHGDRALALLDGALGGPPSVKRAAIASAVAASYRPPDPLRFSDERRGPALRSWKAFERRLTGFLGDNVNFALEDYSWDEEGVMPAEPGVSAGLAGDDPGEVPRQTEYSTAQECVRAAAGRDPELLAVVALLAHQTVGGEVSLRARAVRGLATVALRSREPYRFICYQALCAARDVALPFTSSSAIAVLDALYAARDRADEALAGAAIGTDGTKQLSPERERELTNLHRELLRHVQSLCPVPEALYRPLGAECSRLLSELTPPPQKAGGGGAGAEGASGGGGGGQILENGEGDKAAEKDGAPPNSAATVEWEPSDASWGAGDSGTFDFGAFEEGSSFKEGHDFGGQSASDVRLARSAQEAGQLCPRKVLAKFSFAAEVPGELSISAQAPGFVYYEVEGWAFLETADGHGLAPASYLTDFHV